MAMADERNLMDVVHMKKYFPIRGGFFKRPIGSVKAVDNVSFFIRKGETLGLVGESGCGKTTVGRSIMMLTPPTEGYVFFETPTEIVTRFKKVLELLNGAEKGKMGVETAVAILEGVDRLVNTPECGIKEEKAKRVCADALKLVEKLRTGGTKDTREDDVRDIAETALEEIARKHTINFKSKASLRRMRSRIQFVFQDPFSSLDPKMLVKDIVAEPVEAQLKNYKLVKRKDAKGKTIYQMVDKRYKLVRTKDASGVAGYKVVPRETQRPDAHRRRRPQDDEGVLQDKMGLVGLSGEKLTKKHLDAGPRRQAPRARRPRTSSTCTGSRTSSAAGSGRGSASRGRCRSTPTSSCWTSRPRPSTSASRRRYSTCSTTSRTTSG